MKRPEPVQYQVVNMVRAFAILVVLMFHFGLGHLTDRPKLDILEMWWTLFWRNGSYGVSIFFVVSGFLITKLLAEQPGGLFTPDLKDFYIRRVARILPLLTLVVLFGGLFIILVPNPSGPFAFCLRSDQASYSLGFWVSICTFTFNWYKAFIAHPVKDFALHWDGLWSLAVEEQFYLFYPFFLKKIRTEKNLYLFLLTFLVLGTLSRVVGLLFFPQMTYWNLNSFEAFDTIALGCLLYLISNHYKDLLVAKKLTCVFFCLAGLFIISKTFLCIPTDLNYEQKLFSAISAGGGAFLFLLGGINLNFFQSKWLSPLAFPGKLSYGLYLLNPVVLFGLWFFIQGGNEKISFAIFFFTALLLAWISYRFFEMPANRWIRNFFRSKEAKAQ